MSTSSGSNEPIIAKQQHGSSILSDKNSSIEDLTDQTSNNSSRAEFASDNDNNYGLVKNRNDDDDEKWASASRQEFELDGINLDVSLISLSFLPFAISLVNTYLVSFRKEHFLNMVA